MISLLGQEVMSQNTLNAYERRGLVVLADLITTEEILQTCDDCHHPERRIPGLVTAKQREDKTEEIRLSNGCIGPGAENKPHQYGQGYGDVGGRVGEKLWQCPRLFQKDSALIEYVRAFLWYEDKGTLPNAGGLNDQPAKLVSALEIIRSEVRRIGSEKQKARAQKARMKARSHR